MTRRALIMAGAALSLGDEEAGMVGFLRRIFGSGMAHAAPAADDDQPEPIDREDTAAKIDLLVRGGFETPASTRHVIFEEYLELVAMGPDDRRWTEDEIDRAFARKRADEATWPATTDVDRLFAAFDALDAKGIVALHKTGNTISDGISDAAEARHERRTKAHGFVFYHGQDLDRAVEGDELYLAFGSFDDRDDVAAMVGTDIVAPLQGHRLPTKWDGDAGTRIVVSPIRWRKRSPIGG